MCRLIHGIMSSHYGGTDKALNWYMNEMLRYGQRVHPTMAVAKRTMTRPDAMHMSSGHTLPGSHLPGHSKSIRLAQSQP
jgi:hypothetical protein